MLIEVNKLVVCRLNRKLIKSALSQAYKIAKSRKKINMISVALVDKKAIRILNRKYRRVDKVTDVLAFDDPAEIVICRDQLVRQAEEQKHGQNRELIILLIHGLLHILGYDHRFKKDKMKMRRMEEKILQLIG